jgi:hypothetical protein
MYDDDLKYFVDNFLKYKSERSLRQLKTLIDAIYIGNLFNYELPKNI